MNTSVIIKIPGGILMLNGLSMLLPLPVSLWTHDGSFLVFVSCGSLGLLLGGTLWKLGKTHHSMSFREANLSLILSWLTVVGFSSLPFLFLGNFSFTNAWFESISAVTTTGFTITNPESLTPGLSFWRGFLQFLGGGMVLSMFLLFMPALGIMPDLSVYKPDSSIRSHTMFRLSPDLIKNLVLLWIIYAGLVLLEFFLLWLAGMELLDAIGHAFGTLSTTGSPLKQESVKNFSPAIQWIITVFMILGGCNFLLYTSLIQKNFIKIGQCSELYWYLGILGGMSLIVTLVLLNTNGFSLESGIRAASFQTVSIMTSTGYVTQDYQLWPQNVQALLFLAMFTGRCLGSTGSGIRIIHMVILLQYLLSTGKKVLQPLAIAPIRTGGKTLDSDILYNILGFVAAHLFLVVVGGILLSWVDDMNYISAFSRSISSLWNLGVGFNEAGPFFSQNEVSSFGKWIMGGWMLLGRLEIIPFMLLLHRPFWKRQSYSF
ncbi:MAG: TrkH family potassium uptake protein [SAR324 cluster bacterium]|nr:TrkH family potassium uptake protein [SAR324 cluster bacterium]